MKNACLLLILLTSVTRAQFAIANGGNGFTAVRGSASQTAAVVATLLENAVLYAFEDEQKAGWIPVDYATEPEILSGFVQKRDIKMVSDFLPVPYSYSNKNKYILARDNIGIILTKIDYAKGNSVFTFADDNPTILLKIDGKEFYGTDGEIPTRQYGFITVTIGKDRIQFPNSATEGLFEPNLESTEAYYDAKNDILYIKAMNSDGAGGYAILWTVEKRKYKSRYVFYPF
jgi:hypothetical protein